MSINDFHPLKPPLAWLGGKSRLRHIIISMIPPDHTTYVEVFGGAMWVMFGKGHSQVEVYNDANVDLVNYWRVIKSQRDKFLDAIDGIFASRTLYSEFVLADRSKMNEVERAVAFWYLLKLGFGGMVQKDLMLRPSSPPPSICRSAAEGIIRQASTRIETMWIENLDFLELITRWDRKFVFFYLDPPYYETKGYTGAGVNPFGVRQHELLHDTLTRKVKGRWMISINDCEWYRNKYKEYWITEAKVFYSMCKDKKDTEVKELIITSYEPQDKQQSLLSVMGSPQERDNREARANVEAERRELEELEAEFGLEEDGGDLDTTRGEDGVGGFRPPVDDATPYTVAETEGAESAGAEEVLGNVSGRERGVAEGARPLLDEAAKENVAAEEDLTEIWEELYGDD